VFLGAVGFGAYYTWDQLLPFFNKRPIINGFILFVGLVGLALSLFELFRGIIEARRLRDILKDRDEGTSEEPQPGNTPTQDQAFQRANQEKIRNYREKVADSGSGMVNQRLGSILSWADESPESVEEISFILSQADTQSVDNRGIIASYLLGVMVFLGLLGTFWGLLITVQGVNDVLATLEPETIDDPASFLEQLKTSMGGMLGGMSTAFSTSLFGLGGSLILGFAEMTARRSRSQLLVDLDKAVANHIIPLMGKGKAESDTSLRRVEKNTESLPGVAREITTHGRRFTDTLNRIAQLLEKPRDSAAQLEEVKGLISESTNELHTASENLSQISQNLHKPLSSFEEASGSLFREISETRNAIETLADNIEESMGPMIEVSNQVSEVFEDNKQLREKMDRVYELGLEKLLEEVDRRRPGKSPLSGDSTDSLMPTEPEDQE
jgi:predicted  nucleic acid-binding Zn-ribbon protein